MGFNKSTSTCEKRERFSSFSSSSRTASPDELELDLVVLQAEVCGEHCTTCEDAGNCTACAEGFALNENDDEFMRCVSEEDDIDKETCTHEWEHFLKYKNSNCESCNPTSAYLFCPGPGDKYGNRCYCQSLFECAIGCKKC